MQRSGMIWTELQWLLTGRAQEAYSAVCGGDPDDESVKAYSDYESAKAAELKAYKNCRKWVKDDEQTHVEFVI